ncbi:helix-turn-helix domain-containing protein [Planctomicrobium sp. SH664]|uniref:helix-turn-helix domain-containing protein n=1 Tax=Planctomicrobium sp. SH664 TaxID=3448125 RepID=UPI003F5B64B1
MFPMRSPESQRFVPLPENRLAIAAVRRLAPGIKRRTVRLVTLVAPPGAGKSHLVRELIRSWEATAPQGRVLTVTASQFSAQLAEASAANTIPQFQLRYRRDMQLLACEDLQALNHRKESQQQLLAAIDEIIAKGGLVLLTSTRMPGDLGGLSRRLVNRIHGGVCVNMELPGERSRRKLLEQFLLAESLTLPPDKIEAAAAKYAVSPRELRGLLTQLRAEGQLPAGKKGAAAPDLKSLIQERQPAKTVNVEVIARESAARFQVKVADLKGPRRSQTISRARQVAMYLARELAGMNYLQIGTYFNRGNHSTVIHACQKIAAARTSDAVLAHEIAAIARAISSR